MKEKVTLSKLIWYFWNVVFWIAVVAPAPLMYRAARPGCSVLESLGIVFGFYLIAVLLCVAVANGAGTIAVRIVENNDK